MITLEKLQKAFENSEIKYNMTNADIKRCSMNLFGRGYEVVAPKGVVNARQMKKYLAQKLWEMVAEKFGYNVRVEE